MLVAHKLWEISLSHTSITKPQPAVIDNHKHRPKSQVQQLKTNTRHKKLSGAEVSRLTKKTPYQGL